MTLKEYIKEAVKTNSSVNFLSDDVKKLGLNENILHSIIGIQTESNELTRGINVLTEKVEKNENISNEILNIIEEYGDIFWYIAVGLNELGFNELEEVTKDNLLLTEDYDPLDKAKRTLYYGAEFNKEQYKQFLLIFIDYLQTQINAFYMDFGINVENALSDVLEKNIKKLKKRYGEKFDKEKALNRNTKEEYDAMK